MNHNITLLNLMVGAALPHAIALINQVQWRAQIKAGIAFVVCLVAAAITTYATGHLNLTDWGLAASTVFTAAQVSYKGLWKPLGSTTAIENATSLEPVPKPKAKRKAAKS